MKRLLNRLFGGSSDPLVTRLVRNIAPEDVNEVIAELEEADLEILTVIPRMVMVEGPGGQGFLTVYDILVFGDTDPTWGVYGQ